MEMDIDDDGVDNAASTKLFFPFAVFQFSITTI